MKLDEAVERLEQYQGIKFSSLFRTNPALKIDKGRVGKLLEKLIGLPNSSRLRDFEDGELKTNKADVYALPLETMFISQLSKEFDNVIGPQSFEESHIYRKIKRGAYVPVCKSGEMDDWYFHPCIEWDLEKDSELFKSLERDYYKIKNEIIHYIEERDGQLHTSSGKYIQIRTKDAKPYNPIYSRTYQKEVSNKNFAFYFKKDFMRYLQRKNNYTPITSPRD
ncbi:MAG: DNA mismatch repair protein MutH [Candidatus Heimdallarchaeaceae archaeon]